MMRKSVNFVEVLEQLKNKIANELIVGELHHEKEIQHARDLNEVSFSDCLLAREGRDVLNLAATCKAAVAFLSPIISSTLFFRHREKSTYKYYSPSCMTVMEESAISSIPSHLTKVHINITSEKPPAIPPHLTSLFTTQNLSSSSSSLPLSLTHLTASFFNQDKITFPPLLSHLDCTVEEDANLSGWILPPTLTHFTLSSTSFRQTVLPSLPPGLTHFTIKGGHTGVAPTISSLPSSLLYLRIRCMSTESALPSLPPSLQNLHLEIGESHELPSIPSSLQSLILPGETDYTESSFPPSLTAFNKVDRTSNHPPIPSSLRELYLYREDRELPPLLSHLAIEVLAGFSHFPTSITYLELDLAFTSKIPDLPSLPPRLTHLIFKTSIPPPESFPATLTHLTFHSFYKKPFILPPLPTGLRYFSLNYLPNQSFPLLPPSLRSLIWTAPSGTDFEFPPLPSTLRFLRLPVNFTGTLSPSLQENDWKEEKKEKEKEEKEKEKEKRIPRGLMTLECGRTFFEKNNLEPEVPPQCIFALL